MFSRCRAKVRVSLYNAIHISPSAAPRKIAVAREIRRWVVTLWERGRCNVFVAMQSLMERAQRELGPLDM